MNTNFKENIVDVICQHTRDSKIIPIKIRIQDEDGEFHNYTIKSYKDRSPSSTYQMPNGISVSRGTWTFDCKIAVFDTLKTITLFYTPSDNKWTISK